MGHMQAADAIQCVGICCGVGHHAVHSGCMFKGNVPKESRSCPVSQLQSSAENSAEKEVKCSQERPTALNILKFNRRKQRAQSKFDFRPFVLEKKKRGKSRYAHICCIIKCGKAFQSEIPFSFLSFKKSIFFYVRDLTLRINLIFVSRRL